MRDYFPPITINFAPVKVIGIPGLSLVAIAVAIVLEFPVGRWLLLSGIVGGVLVAVALIRHRRPRETAGIDRPRGSLMACDLPSTGQGGWSSRQPSESGSDSLPEPSSRSPKTMKGSAFGAWRPARGW